MIQRDDERMQEECVRETLLDLGPGESWLDPDKEAVKRVAVALLAAGCAAESVEHLTSQMVKLTGRRNQDAIAVGQTTDKDLNALICEAVERLDWLVGVLRYGHPEGKADRLPLDDEEPFAGLLHPDHSERILPPGSQRVVTSFARALKSDNIDTDDAVQLLQRIRQAIWQTPSRPLKQGPLDKVAYEAALAQFLPFGVQNASDAVTEKAASQAYLTVSHGRPPVSEALVDWVAATSALWKQATGAYPGKTRDVEGRYIGPFFDLLADLQSAYSDFPASRVTRTVLQKGLERALLKDK